VINAGGSLGQFVFAPISQGLITVLGWVGAMFSLAAITLATLPIARAMRRSPAAAAAAAQNAGGGLRQAIREAFADRSYLLLHAGFFTCGFHIAFLVTHLPGEVNLCGLPPSVASWSLALIGLANIAGSLLVGQAVNRWRSKQILFWMYLSRTVLVLLYLAAPKTAFTFYVFAIGLGLTWLATVPPTAAIVGKLFGVRYLATLFGMTLLSHQVGGFFGAWLGGLAIDGSGNYLWMWYADAVLALAAALVNLPIREPKVVHA
jgi:predicted MFS family arabinose efflux permease